MSLMIVGISRAGLLQALVGVHKGGQKCIRDLGQAVVKLVAIGNQVTVGLDPLLKRASSGIDSDIFFKNVPTPPRR